MTTKACRLTGLLLLVDDPCDEPVLDAGNGYQSLLAQAATQTPDVLGRNAVMIEIQFFTSPGGLMY